MEVNTAKKPPVCIFPEKNSLILTVYLPTQIRFPIGGERVKCYLSKLTNSLGKQQFKLLTRT